jgi:SOS-response transcriptional repressor LexA
VTNDSNFPIKLENAYAWLHRFDASRLSAATKPLVKQMDDACKIGNAVQAWSDIQRLKSLALQLPSEQEVAEVMLECGKTAFEMGYLDESAHLLEDAVQRYHGHLHHQGVAQWMLGYVYWISQTHHDAGIIAWQSSISSFRRLVGQKYHHDHAIEPKWYMDRLDEMRAALECAINADCISPPRPVVAAAPGVSPTPIPPFPATPSPVSPSAPTTPATPTSPTQPASSPPPIYRRHDRLRIAPVSGRIPAGGFGSAVVDPYPSGYIEVDQVMVDGIPHRLVGLRGSNVIQLQVGEPYMTLEVYGDSMNQEGPEGIENGDYVLLHMGDKAQEGDVVAAEIVDEDERATLKRYLRRGRKIVLQPNSSNPLHEPHIFERTEIGKSFFIRGVALAVLKPEAP